VELIRAAAELSAATDAWRDADARVGLVPTMGALHEGHAALMRAARQTCDRVGVSIFVNPLQFGDPGDLEAYPRDEAADLAFCASEGVDAVWVPPVDQVYPPGADLVAPDPGPVGETFEGASRPGHFAGVLKVVHRLFDVVGPSTSFFGEKDAQQLFLVRRMVAELAMPIQVVAVPTVREPDGLALSSRNARLAPAEREQAGCLFLALTEAAALARAGERDAAVLVAAMAREIGATPLARLDYAAVVDDATFQPVVTLGAPARAIVAAAFPSARLIDTLALPVNDAVTVEPPDPPDRTEILAAVMPALLATQGTTVTPTGGVDDDATGRDTVVATTACVVAGLPVAREAFARLGVRFRPLVTEGTALGAADVVAEVGGPIAAIHRASPVALGFLARLSAIASGTRAPDPSDGLERYAAELRLSPSAAVDDDGPSFRLGSEG
jgi:pantoate--beta-alanine ligase